MSLHGFINVDANDLQFSINSLNPKTMRILPQVFQDRMSLPLYSEELTLSESTLHDFKVCLLRFKTICKDYGVRQGNNLIIVGSSIPEGTQRNEIIEAIKSTNIDWPINCLTEEDEFQSFLYGLAGAFHPVQGLFLKVTARSVYLSWIHYSDKNVLTYGSAHKLPYGGVSLARRLTKESFEELEKEIAERVAQVFSQLELPTVLQQMAAEEGGLRVYVHSRGFPSIMRFMHGANISAVLLAALSSTGFSCVPSDVLDVSESTIKQHRDQLEKTSKLRAAFFLATLSLLRGVGTGIPSARKFLYDRSTVGEGILFRQMPDEIFAQDPLIVCTSPFALPGAPKLANLLSTAIPKDFHSIISKRIVKGVANAAYIHSSYSKSAQPLLGLMIGISGILTGVPGLTHEVRVLLGIALYQRWGGTINESARILLESFQRLFNDPERFFWAYYVGCVMHVIGGVCPGAQVREDVISFSVDGCSENFTLNIRINQKSIFANNPIVRERLRKLPGTLSDGAQLLGFEKTPVTVNVEWYSSSE